MILVGMSYIQSDAPAVKHPFDRSAIAPPRAPR
jgi:hypothetical protein